MGIGLLELVIIAIAALVLLGPERLPEVLRQLGRVYVQLRRTSNEFRGVFDNMVRQAEEELRIAEIKRLTELANQGSQIAKNAAQHLDQFGHTTAHAPLDPSAPVVPPPQGRDAEAHRAWDHYDRHGEQADIAKTEPAPLSIPPETKP